MKISTLLLAVSLVTRLACASEFREEVVPEKETTHVIRVLKIVEKVQARNFYRDGKLVGAVLHVKRTDNISKPSEFEFVRFCIDDENCLEARLSDRSFVNLRSSGKLFIETTDDGIDVGMVDKNYFEVFDVKERKFMNDEIYEGMKKAFIGGRLMPSQRLEFIK